MIQIAPNSWQVAARATLSSPGLSRKAGSVSGFKYSDALKTADWIWDEAHLDSWIENAQAMRPGVFMPYRQADPAKRAKVIAFLKSFGTSK